MKALNCDILALQELKWVPKNFKQQLFRAVNQDEDEYTGGYEFFVNSTRNSAICYDSELIEIQLSAMTVN